VRLTLVRDRARRDVTVELGEFERPPSVARRGSGQHEGRGLLGFDVQSLTPALAARFELGEREGVVVTDVVPFGPAASAGLRPGQLILQINGEKVSRPEDVDRIAAKLSPGSVASVRVRDPRLGETIINYRVEE